MFLSDSKSVFIKIRYLPQKDIDEVLAGVSKYFDVVSIDIRKRHGGGS